MDRRGFGRSQENYGHVILFVVWFILRLFVLYRKIDLCPVKHVLDGELYSFLLLIGQEF